ncbi:MAG: hypothetical protein HQK52_06045 [Oligoflexia bacterium]|nr:hypothetical protein [Oligoflexia bacterium]
MLLRADLRKNLFFYIISILSLLGNFYFEAKAETVNTVDTEVGISSAQATACVEKAMEKLEINLDMKTDISLLNEIFDHDMQLADFAAAKKLLGDKLTKATSMRPMLEVIKQAIIQKQPAIAQFLCLALKKDLLKIPDDNAKNMIARTLHLTFLLEEITKEMANNLDFSRDIYNYYLQVSKDKFNVCDSGLTYVKDLYRIYGDWFMPAKSLAMDWAFTGIMEKRAKGFVTDKETEIGKTKLILNIAEAIAADYFANFKNNLLAGVALAINPYTKAEIEGEKKAYEQHFSPGWTSLYETWNMAFITGNINNLHLVYPKLLIPSVINADSKDYIFNRSLSLWLTLKFTLFAKANDANELKLPNSKELAEVWGEVNAQHAKDFVKRTNGTELNGISDLFLIPIKGVGNKIRHMFE